MIQLIFFTHTGFCENDHKNYTTYIKKGPLWRQIGQIPIKR